MLKCKWIRVDVFWLLLHEKKHFTNEVFMNLLPAFIRYAQSKDIITIGGNTSTIYALQTIYSGFFWLKASSVLSLDSLVFEFRI